MTDSVPKALVAVAGRPLIDYSLATLVRSGVRDIIINLHHLGDQIRDHVGDGSAWGATVSYSVEDPPLGSGGGIAKVRPLLGSSTFVTLNADTIIDLDLREVLDFHRSRLATATLVLRKDPRMGEFGLIHTESGGRVGQFLDWTRPGSKEPLEPWMYTGVQVLEPRVFDFMPVEREFSMTRLTYPEMIMAGEAVFGYSFRGRWLTVGTPEELEAAEQGLSSEPLGGM